MGAIHRGIKNAFRNLIRTFSIVIILGLSIGLALTMLIARQAVQSKIDSVKGSIGNMITVSPAGARGFEGGGEPLKTDQIAQIKTLPHISSVTQTLNDRLDSKSTNLQSAVDAGSIGRRFQGQGDSSQGNTRSGSGNANFTPPVMTVGSTDLSALQSFGGGSINLTSGEKFDANVDAPVALLGKSLAEKNNLKVGSTFQAYSENITVKGIFDTGNSFSNNLVVMPLSTLGRLSGQAGAISSAIVQVDSIENMTSTVDTIKTKLGTTADVVSQQDTSTQALEPLENIKSISMISLIGAVAAGAVIILLVMMMIVRERRREIGVLKAIGATNIKVMAQFVFESITLTVMGTAVGILVGVFGSSPITKVLVQTSTSTAQQSGQGGAREAGGIAGRMMQFAGQGGASLRNIQTSVDWHIVLYGIGVAILIAILGSAIPAFFISKIRPAEVMRTE